MGNIKKIQGKLAKFECEAILITSPVNRFFATGFASSAGALIITEKDAWFFTDFRYIEMARAKITDAKVHPISDKDDETYSAQIKALLDKNNIVNLGFENNKIIHADYLNWKKKLKVKMKPCGKLLDDLRGVKTKAELDKMIASQRLTEKAFDEVLPLISTDMTEKQLAAELVYSLLKNGADDKAFEPIVASGSKSSMPHAKPGSDKLSHGFLTIDFGARLGGWCSDMTRTLCIGMPDDEMINVYNTVLNAQEAGIKAVRAGVKGVDVDAASRNVISDAGYGEYFGHSFGHSIGLEVHESLKVGPSSKDILPEGSVISAEPGIYLPGRFGVRIEDLVFVTKDGCENFTKTTKEMIVLDRF